MKKTEEMLENCGGIRVDTPIPRKDLTELVFIIDRSGSMQGLEGDTVGGFNTMIEKQKNVKGECYVSTVLFNDVRVVLHDRVKLSEVPKMKMTDYCPMGCTALIDAIGCAIKHIGNVHKYARPEDRPGNTMFVITTDGLENASTIYSSDKVKKMIEEKKKQGWEFLFIGANIDAVETAARYGIDRNRAVNYHSDKEGTHVLYNAMAETLGEFIECEAVSENWSKEIRADFCRRKRK